MLNQKEKRECKENKTLTATSISNEKNGIKVVDGNGYDIEQFLCRCGNKNVDAYW